MAGSSWTASELLDVQVMPWPLFHEKYPSRTFDAWEVKRRRVAKPKEAEGNYGPKEKIVIPRAEDCANFSIAFYDIETTMGRARRLLTGALVNAHGEYQLFDYYTNPGKAWWDDSELTRAYIEALRPFNILVGWNSKAFDLKVLNGRAAIHGIPVLRPQLHLDLMWTYRIAMDVGGSSLQNISEVFESQYKKIPLTPRMHAEAEAGNKEPYDVLREHNVADVLLTRDAFVKALPFVTTLNKSPLF